LPRNALSSAEGFQRAQRGLQSRAFFQRPDRLFNKR
jgi:hypothetical protein